MAEDTKNSGKINAQPSSWGNVRTYLDELKFGEQTGQSNPSPSVPPTRQVRVTDEWSNIQSIEGPAMAYLPVDAELQGLNPTTSIPVVHNPFDIEYPDITQMSEDDAFAWLQFCADGSATGVMAPYLSALTFIDHFTLLSSEEYAFLLQILKEEEINNVRKGVYQENPFTATYDKTNLLLLTKLHNSQVMYERRSTYQTYANIIAYEFLTAKSEDLSKKDFGPYLKIGIDSAEGMFSMPSTEILNVMKKLHKKIELGKDKLLLSEQEYELLCEKYTALSFIHDYNKEFYPDAKSKREKSLLEKGWDILVTTYSRALVFGQLGKGFLQNIASFFSNYIKPPKVKFEKRKKEALAKILKEDSNVILSNPIPDENMTPDHALCELDYNDNTTPQPTPYPNGDHMPKTFPLNDLEKVNPVTIEELENAFQFIEDTKGMNPDLILISQRIDVTSISHSDYTALLRTIVRQATQRSRTEAGYLGSQDQIRDQATMKALEQITKYQEFESARAAAEAKAEAQGSIAKKWGKRALVAFGAFGAAMWIAYSPSKTTPPEKVKYKVAQSKPLNIPEETFMNGEAKQLARAAMEEFAGKLTSDTVRACASKFAASGEVSKYDAGVLWYLSLPQNMTDPFCNQPSKEQLPYIALQLQRAEKKTTTPPAASEQNSTVNREETFLFTGYAVTPLKLNRVTGEKLNISPNSTRSSEEAMDLAQQNLSTTAVHVKVKIKKATDGSEVLEFLNKDGTPFIPQPVPPSTTQPKAQKNGLAV